MGNSLDLLSSGSKYLILLTMEVLGFSVSWEYLVLLSTGSIRFSFKLEVFCSSVKWVYPILLSRGSIEFFCQEWVLVSGSSVKREHLFFCQVAVPGFSVKLYYMYTVFCQVAVYHSSVRYTILENCLALCSVCSNTPHTALSLYKL